MVQVTARWHDQPVGYRGGAGSAHHVGLTWLDRVTKPPRPRGIQYTYACMPDNSYRNSPHSSLDERVSQMPVSRLG